MAANQTGPFSRPPSSNPPRPGQHNSLNAGLSGQVQGTVRNVAEGASELWDDAYEQRERYYRQGRQAIERADSTTMMGWLVAGAVGFGIAWLMFGHRSADDVAERMSESSDRPRRR